MAAPSELPALEARARRLETEHDWEGAAGAWASIADVLGRGGDGERAARAWDAAGEAWRRDDRPALADKALRTALALTEDPGLSTIVRVKRSGCLAAQGQVVEAKGCLHQAMLGPNHVQAVVADGLVDMALLEGNASAASRWTDRIVGDSPLIAATRAYRGAQCARLAGNLGEAASLLDKASSDLPGLAGKAAICSERAELASLRADADAALDRRREAVALHAQERRHGPMWSSMAALSRTATHLGVELTHMPGMESMPSVAEALRSVHALATEHGLALVALDLEIARALAESDGDALVRASDAAAEMGAGLRAGRSRLDGVMLGLLPVSAVEAALGHLANAPLYTHLARAAMSDADSVAWLESHGVVHR